MAFQQNTFSGQPTKGFHECQPGARVGGYELLDLLGKGGMGQVWKAHDSLGDRLVAIKLLPPEFRGNDEAIAQVRSAFQAVHELTHQCLCKVIALGEDLLHGPFLVMDYIPGVTLSKCRRGFTDGRLPLDLVRRILGPVANALDYAHRHVSHSADRQRRGVLHRDVKPQNIMLCLEGGTLTQVCLIDLGLAAELRSAATNCTQAKVDTRGTRPYMSPEQLSGKRSQWDGRTDQYSLAVVAYELLAGHPPFEADDDFLLVHAIKSEIPDVIDGLSGSVNAALQKALAKDKGDRFNSCADFVEALVDAANDSNGNSPSVQFESDPLPLLVETPAKLLKRIKAEVAAQMEQARALMAKYEYAAVVAVLEGFTLEQTQLRDNAMLREATEKRDQLQRLSQTIRKLIDARRFYHPQLAFCVDEYLKLKPDDAEMRELADELPKPVDIVSRVEQLINTDPSFAQAIKTAFGVVGPVTLSDLVKKLTSNDANVRWGAAVALGKIGSAAIGAVAELIPRVADPYGNVREAAWTALVAIEGWVQSEEAKEGLAGLANMMARDDVDALRSAARVTEAMRENAAAGVSHLVKNLTNGNANVRWGAAVALGKIGPAAIGAVAELIPRVADPYGNVREAAWTALVAIEGWVQSEEAKEGLAGLANMMARDDVDALRSAARVTEAMRENAAAGVPHLVKNLTNGNANVRWGAAVALGKIGPAAIGAVAELIPRVADPYGSVREAAWTALVAIEGWEKSEVARDGLAGLANMMARDEVDALRLAARVTEAMRENAAAGVPHLVKNLTSGNANVRWGAAVALGEIGPAAIGAVADLIPRVADPYQNVREAAWTALVAIEGWVQSEEAKAGLAGLAIMMARDDVDALRSAARVTEAMRENAAAGVPHLVKNLTSGNANARCGAAVALGKIGPAAIGAVAHLIPRVADPYASVREAAWTALVAIEGWEKSEEAREGLAGLANMMARDDVDALRSAARVTEAMRENAAAGVPHLLKNLTNGNVNVRWGAAVALGLIGPAAREALPALSQLAKSDPGSGARAAAAEAVQVIGV